NAHEFIAGRFLQIRVGESDRHIGHDAQVAAQIVRRLAPEAGPLLLECANLAERGLETGDMTSGLLLLEQKILRDTLFHGCAANRSPTAPRLRQDIQLRL